MVHRVSILLKERDSSLDSPKRTNHATGNLRVIVKLSSLILLQDILDGLSNEDQAVFLKWQKVWSRVIKLHSSILTMYVKVVVGKKLIAQGRFT